MSGQHKALVTVGVVFESRFVSMEDVLSTFDDL